MLGYKDHYPKYSTAAETPSHEGADPPSTTTMMARGVALVVSVLACQTVEIRVPPWAKSGC